MMGKSVKNMIYLEMKIFCFMRSLENGIYREHLYINSCMSSAREFCPFQEKMPFQEQQLHFEPLPALFCCNAQ